MNKFRVWDEATNTMYFPGEDGTQLVFGVTHVFGEEGYPIWQLWDAEGEVTREGKAELMQCTGLKDQIGVEVYEGDIVAYEDAGEIQTSCGTEYDEFVNEGVIEWSEDEARYTVTNRETIDIEGFWEYILDSEVIGNIYENSELLEVTN